MPDLFAQTLPFLKQVAKLDAESVVEVEKVVIRGVAHAKSLPEFERRSVLRPVKLLQKRPTLVNTGFEGWLLSHCGARVRLRRGASKCYTKVLIYILGLSLKVRVLLCLLF